VSSLECSCRTILQMISVLYSHKCESSLLDCTLLTADWYYSKEASAEAATTVGFSQYSEHILCFIVSSGVTFTGNPLLKLVARVWDWIYNSCLLSYKKGTYAPDKDSLGLQYRITEWSTQEPGTIRSSGVAWWVACLPLPYGADGPSVESYTHARVLFPCWQLFCLSQ
jgi:hypothetical protein